MKIKIESMAHPKMKIKGINKFRSILSSMFWNVHYFLGKSAFICLTSFYMAVEFMALNLIPEADISRE